MAEAHRADRRGLARFVDDAARGLVGLSVLVGLTAWAHVFYRVWLFVFDYDCRVGMNHLEDDFFSRAYALHGAIIALMCFALWRLWPVRWERRIAGATLGLHVLVVLAVVVMHRTGMLVGYGEYVQRYGP